MAWTLVEKVVCFYVMAGERIIARIDKPRIGDQLKVEQEAKLMASAPELARLLGKLVTIVKGDALLMYDHEVGALAEEAETLLGAARLEPADGR